MKDTLEKEAYLRRNLKDAGCDERTIEKFFRLSGHGRTGEQLRLLAQQRSFLLRQVHENQRKIDCLDFLIYCMNSKN